MTHIHACDGRRDERWILYTRILQLTNLSLHLRAFSLCRDCDRVAAARRSLRLVSPQNPRNILEFCPPIPLKRLSGMRWTYKMPASFDPLSYPHHFSRRHGIQGFR